MFQLTIPLIKAIAFGLLKVQTLCHLSPSAGNPGGAFQKEIGLFYVSIIYKRDHKMPFLNSCFLL